MPRFKEGPDDQPTPEEITRWEGEGGKRGVSPLPVRRSARVVRPSSK